MLYTLLIILVLGSAILLVVFYPANSQESLMQEAFKEADIINDGFIDPGEFDIYHFRIFKRLDKDMDNALTLKECVSSCFTPRPGSEKAANSGKLSYHFEDIDMDGSGSIIEYEYILYGRENYHQYDINYDGVIDRYEFCYFYDKSMPCSFIEIPLSNEEP